MSAPAKHGTAIEWTHLPGTKGETWNPIRARNKQTGGVGHFCTHVSAGCKNCYAERLQVRFKNPVRFAAQDADKVEVFLDEKTLIKPLHWKSPRTIFVCSMTDLFGEFVSDQWIVNILSVAALCPHHKFIILTKRPKRMRHLVRSLGASEGLPAHIIFKTAAALSHADPLECWPLPNVWLGVSAENQETANERIPYLITTPAAVRFVSYEPALGPVDFAEWTEDPDPRMHLTWLDRLDWIIAGGESGPDARHIRPEWFISARDQCAAAGVPFFFKQWGEWLPRDNMSPAEIKSLLLSTTFCTGRDLNLVRVGKRKAGAVLDGREHKAFPELVS